MSSDTSMDLLDDAEIIGRLEQVLASLGSGVGMDSTLEDEEIGGRLEDVLTTLGIAGGGIPQGEDDLQTASRLTVGEDNVASEARILACENVSDNESGDGDRSPLVASDRLLCDNKSEKSDNENAACRKGLSADVAVQDCSKLTTGSEDHALRCTLSEISLANSAWSEISGPDKDYMQTEISNISSPVQNPSTDGVVFIESWDKDEETPADPSAMDPSFRVSLCSDANETSSNDRQVSILPDQLSSCQRENGTQEEPDMDLNINAVLEETVESKSSDADDSAEFASTQSASCQQDEENMEHIMLDVGKSSSYADVPDASNTSLPEDPATPETNIDPGGKDAENVSKDLRCSDNEENPEKTMEKLEEPPVVSENPNKSCDTELSEVGPGDILFTKVRDVDRSHRDIPDMLFRPENPTPLHENPEFVNEDDAVELPSEDCAIDSELPEFPVVEIIPYEDEGLRLHAEIIANFPVSASTTSSVTVTNASTTGFPPGISVVDVGRIFPSPRSVTRLKHKIPEFIDIDNLPDCDSADAIDSDAPVEMVHVKTENADAAATTPFSEDPSERPMCFCPHGFTSRTVGHFHCRYCGLSCRSRSSLRSHEARQHETPVASNTPASAPPAKKNSDASRKKKPPKPGAVTDDPHPKCRCERGFRSEFSQQGHFHCRCCGFSSRYRTAVIQHESLQHKGHTDLIGKRRRNPSENPPSSINPTEAEGATPPAGMTTRNREKSPLEKRIRTGSMVSLSHLSTFSDGKSAATAETSAVPSDGENGKTPAESSEMELSENPDGLTTLKPEVIEDAGGIIGTVLEKPPELASNSVPTSDTDKNVSNDQESAKHSDSAVGQSTIVTVATDGSERSTKVDGYSGPLEIPAEVVRGKKAKCPLCVLRFVRIDTLRNHLICVHDILPAGHTRFSCLPCKFDTSYRYIFAGHCSSQMHATVLSSCRIIRSDGAGVGCRANVGSMLHVVEADGSTKTDSVNLESNSVQIASRTPSTRQQSHDVAQLQPEPEPSDQVATVPENISVPESISSSPKQVPPSKTDEELSEAKSDRIRWFYSGGKSSSVSKQKFFDIETFLPPIVWQHSVGHACSEECTTKTTRRKRPTTKTENGMSKTRHGLRTQKTSTDRDCKRRLENTADAKRAKQDEIVLIPSGSDSATNSPHRSTEQKRSLRSTARKSTGSLTVDFGFGKRKSGRVGGSYPAERVTLRESRSSDYVGRIQQERKTSSSPVVVVEDYQSSSRQLRSKSELAPKDETLRRKSSSNNAANADSKSDPSLTMKSVLVTTGKRTPVLELSRTRSAAPTPKSGAGSQATPAKKRASPPPPIDTHNISDDEEDDLEIVENPMASAALGKSVSKNTPGAIAGSDGIVAAVSQFQQTLLTWASAASCLTGAILHEKRPDNPAGFVADWSAQRSSPSADVGSVRRSVGGRHRVEIISAPTNVVVIDDEVETNFRVDAGSSTGTGSVPTLSRPDLNTSQWSANVPPASSSYSSTAGTKSWTYFEPSHPTVSLQSSETTSSSSVGNPSSQPSLLSGRLTSASLFSSGSISTAAWAAIGQSNPSAAQRGRPTPFLPSMASVSSWSTLRQTRPTLAVIGGRSVVSLERFSTDNLWAELCRRGTVRSCTCGMYFMDTTLFMLHRSCHCDTASLRCAFCGHSSANNYDFHAHLLDHKK